MGIEYHIRCQLKPDIDHAEFLDRLENPTDADGWSAFTVSLEEFGFYFCDNCWSDAASIGFHRLVDYALSNSESVVVEEP
ncbi:MAG TPA: hypothetical protein DDW52_06310 [Planctomycetaceae bacterium]|nr:hypothetical protein [Planctomycetaceae bacterium]